MLNAFLYRKGKPLEKEISRAQMLQALQGREGILWVDLENPTEFESDSLVEIFNFHPLAIEDCLIDNSHPKVDDYEEYLFLVAHSLQTTKPTPLRTAELDIFLGKNFVVTFHKEAIRSISQIRTSILRKPDLFFGFGSDRLVHALLDQLVDNYTPALDEYDAKIDAIEEEIFNHPGQDFLTSVMQVKHDVFQLRRIITPQRDMVNYLTRNPTTFIKPKNMMYFRDVYDHLFRIYGITEGFHESLNSILQAYFSYSSHRLNAVMKRMTILATLTMPVVMIASIYGMNFPVMPALAWKHGFIFSIGLMFLISVGMLFWMKLKKWI